MAKGPTNSDRDRTLTTLLAAYRELSARLDEVAMAVNQHAAVIGGLQQRVNSLALTAALEATGERHAEA